MAIIKIKSDIEKMSREDLESFVMKTINMRVNNAFLMGLLSGHIDTHSSGGEKIEIEAVRVKNGLEKNLNAVDKKTAIKILTHMHLADSIETLSPIKNIIEKHVPFIFNICECLERAPKS